MAHDHRSIEEQLEAAQLELRKSVEAHKKATRGVIDEAEKLARSARASSADLKPVRPSAEVDLTGQFAAFRGA